MKHRVQHAAGMKLSASTILDFVELQALSSCCLVEPTICRLANLTERAINVVSASPIFLSFTDKTVSSMAG
jgi:hypothetical protein